MIKIAGHWEIDYMVPLVESYFWSWPLRDFEVTEWLMCPVSGIKNPEQRVNLTEFPDYKTMLGSCENLKRVFLEPRTNHQNPNTIWLHDFEHPKDCVYVFGSNHYNPSLSHKRKQDVAVSIKTVQDKGVIWANQCAFLVLYDRRIKPWR